jgi:hypothetical protein
MSTILMLIASNAIRHPGTEFDVIQWYGNVVRLIMIIIIIMMLMMLMMVMMMLMLMLMMLMLVMLVMTCRVNAFRYW